MNGIKSFSFFLVGAFCLAAVLRAEEPQKYTLRYKFQPGETVRWEVEHRSNVRSTVSGSTQDAETKSLSVKRWRVAEIRPDGATKFEHSVEWIDMRQKLTGRDEVRYNSRTDRKPPAGFDDAARAVGVTLSIVTIDHKGKVLHRERKDPKNRNIAQTNNPANPAQADGWMTIPLPDHPVAVGQSWSLPQEIDIPLPSGGVKRIRALQLFKLEEVKTGVATIHVSTEILTPISDPAIESQLVQRESDGRVRFDIDAGRVIGQQMDIDKHVVGFRGEASSIHYVNRFAERLLSEQELTAGKPEKRN